MPRKSYRKSGAKRSQMREASRALKSAVHFDKASRTAFSAPSSDCAATGDSRARTAAAAATLDFVDTERLAHGLHAFLVRRPQAAADHAAIDHQVVAVDEARFVGGQEDSSVGDVVDAAGTRDRLQLGHEGLQGLAEGAGLAGG